MVKFLHFSRVAGATLGVFVTFWLVFWYTHRHDRHRHFFFDAQDAYRADPENAALPESAKNGGTFEPLLKHYIGVMQLLFTVAGASIAFGGGAGMVNNAKLLLACGMSYGVAFCALLLWRYDEYSQNMTSYTLPWHATVFALGFTSLLCFMSGYLWWGWELL